MKHLAAPLICCLCWIAAPGVAAPQSLAEIPVPEVEKVQVDDVSARQVARELAKRETARPGLEPALVLYEGSQEELAHVTTGGTSRRVDSEGVVFTVHSTEVRPAVNVYARTLSIDLAEASVDELAQELESKASFRLLDLRADGCLLLQDAALQGNPEWRLDESVSLPWDGRTPSLADAASLLESRGFEALTVAGFVREHGNWPLADADGLGDEATVRDILVRLLQTEAQASGLRKAYQLKPISVRGEAYQGGYKRLRFSVLVIP